MLKKKSNKPADNNGYDEEDGDNEGPPEVQ